MNAQPDLLQLHPALWRAHQLGRRAEALLSTGYAALDAELPGGGWPAGALTELLLPHPGIGELRLLAPALAAAGRDGRSVLLFDPPVGLCAAALQQLGIDPALCIVVSAAQADLWWAVEQALKSGQVGAVAAWPGAATSIDVLRRWQWSAQSHDGPVFVLRGLAVRQRPSPAPLRLVLQSGGADALTVRIAKRRGPVQERLLQLPLPPVLPRRARVRAAGPVAAAVAA